MQKSILRVRVNPRSAQNKVTGWQDGVLSIKLTAPPVEGAANKACIEFLAETLGIRKSQIELKSGATGRDKVFCVEDMSEEEIHLRLSPLNS